MKHRFERPRNNNQRSPRVSSSVSTDLKLAQKLQNEEYNKLIVNDDPKPSSDFYRRLVGSKRDRYHHDIYDNNRSFTRNPNTTISSSSSSSSASSSYYNSHSPPFIEISRFRNNRNHSDDYIPRENTYAASHIRNPSLNELYSREIDENDYNLLLQLEDVKPKHTGASDLQLSTLPSFNYRKKSAKGNKKMKPTGREVILIDQPMVIDLVDSDNEKTPMKENSECCICLQKYEEGDEMVTLPCLHFFHQDCIIPWLKSNCNCPIDKINVEF